MSMDTTVLAGAIHGLGTALKDMDADVRDVNLCYTAAAKLETLQAELSTARRELADYAVEGDREVVRLRQALEAALGLLKRLIPVCQYAHHEKKERHEVGEPCPVEAQFDAFLAAHKDKEADHA